MRIISSITVLGSAIGCLLCGGCLSEADGPGSVVPNKVVESAHPLQDGESQIQDVVVSDVIQQTSELKFSEYHEVQQGETLSAIAKRYETTVEQLVQVNGLGDADRLEAGQWLYLPRADR